MQLLPEGARVISGDAADAGRAGVAGRVSFLGSVDDEQLLALYADALAVVYPPFDELLAMYRRLRSRTLELLSRLSDEDLDAPTKSPPPGLEEWFGTVGQTLLTIALHQGYHGGQASVARRAGGKQPSFVPSQALRDF